MAKLTKAQQAEQLEAQDQLRKWLPVGSTVRTILRHVSQSGMSRSISLIATVDGEPFDITYYAARAMGDKIDQTHGGIKVGGCGMDMGFSLVYSLSRTIYPDGFKCNGNDGSKSRGKRCPSSDHNNDYGQARRDGRDAGLEGDELASYVDQRLSTDLGFRKGRKHDSGGYAISQQWL